MKISLNWLKDWVEISGKPEILGELFTMKTAEIESVERQEAGLEGVVVGELVEIKNHPSADKLHMAKVDIGKDKPIQLIFGETVEMHKGEKVPVAVAPTTLPTGIVVEKKVLRGHASEGMLCLDQELGFCEEGISIQYFPDVKPGTKIAKAMKLNDVILDIDNKSLTHRPDLWGHYGIAREFAGLLRKSLKPYNTELPLKEPNRKLNIAIKNAEISPRFSGCIVSGMKITESPAWMQKRLLAVGIRPINNIVDITNYVMVELGQPMHAYDRQIVGTDTLEIRFAHKGEKLETIDHKIRELREQDPVVTNGKTVMGLAGIMGGTNSEIHSGTTEVIFEAANWNPGIIRKCSTHHGLRSEASQRFEKGLDPGLTKTAVCRAIALLLKTCPNAKLETAVTTAGTWKPKALKVGVDPEAVISKMGIRIGTNEMIKILESIGFKVGKKGKMLTAAVPAHRATGDIETEDDLIEEIARIYGYDKIPPHLPRLPIRLPEENRERVLKHKIRNILSLGLGFTEVVNYSFYSREDFLKCGLAEETHLKLDNYLSEDQSHLRISLVPNLLKAIAKNLRFFDEFKIYEIGRTYENVGKYFPKEEKWITAAVVSKKGDVFREAKGAMEALLKRYGAVKLEIGRGHSFRPYAHPAKYAEYTATEAQGFLSLVFELHPQTAKNFKIENCKIGIFEVNFTQLVKSGQAKKIYEKISKFPSTEFDVSVVLGRERESAEVEEIICKSDPDLISKAELFDIYEGEKVGKDKKSMAFRVTLQAKDRTLTDEDMASVQKEIFENLKSKGGRIRGLNNT